MYRLRMRHSARGDRTANLSFVTDGLRAERERDITINVASPTSPHSVFPANYSGHFHFTRDIVTGASTAHVAVLLVDVLLEPHRADLPLCLSQHAARRPHLIVRVNKIALVDHRPEVFARARAVHGLRRTARRHLSEINPALRAARRLRRQEIPAPAAA